jgi:uncharacterized cofD-like protein
MSELKIVTIGGGTGSFNILQGLKKLSSDITAIISMVDDGGSTGVLRDELGVLPPGDVRQALVALSESTQLTRELFNYRFEEGTFEGHSFGNLFLSALEKVSGNFGDAVTATSDILKIRGQVVPVTLDDARLVLHYPDGEEVVGEHIIDEVTFRKDARPEVQLRPNCQLNPKAKQAIARADVIIFAPGTLHGSLLPNLAVDGMREALGSTNAKIAYVCNLVTNEGQTDDWQVNDFVEEIERYSGQDSVDYVLYNTAEPSKELLAAYAKDGELGVKYNQEKIDSMHFTPIADNFVAEPDGPDSKGRQFIRHDAEKVTAWVEKIAQGQVNG